MEAVNLHRHVEGWPNYSQGLVYYYMDRTRAKGSEDSCRVGDPGRKVKIGPGLIVLGE